METMIDETRQAVEPVLPDTSEEPEEESVQQARGRRKKRPPSYATKRVDDDGDVGDGGDAAIDGADRQDEMPSDNDRNDDRARHAAQQRGWEDDTVPGTPRGQDRQDRRQRMPYQGPRDIPASDFDFDAWITGFDWSQPGMHTKLVRHTPASVNGVKTAGHLARKDGPYDMEEVQGTYGGGDYEAFVYGLRGNKHGGQNISLLGRRKFTIAGSPILSPDTVPEGGIPSGRNNPFNHVQQPDPTVGRVLERSVGFLQEQARANASTDNATLNTIQGAYQKSVATIEESVRERVEAHRQSAERAVEAAQVRVDDARREAQIERERALKLETELREIERKMSVEKEVIHKEVSDRISRVQGDSSNLLTALLPTFNQSAQEQVRAIQATYDARLEREQASRAADLQQANQIHERQLKAQEMAFQNQIDSIKLAQQTTIAILNQQLEALRIERDSLRREVDEARRSEQRARDELMKTIVEQKASKPVTEQLGEMSTMLELIDTLAARKGGGSEGEEEEGGPVVKMVKGLAEKFGPVAVDYIQNRQAMQAQNAMQAAHIAAQQQQQQQQAPRLPAAPRRVGPPVAQPQARPRPMPPRAPKIDPVELQKAITMINGVLASGNPPSANDVANVAMTHVDHSVLRELARRPSEPLIRELLRKGVISVGTPCARPEGQAFLADLLGVLRERLVNTGAVIGSVPNPVEVAVPVEPVAAPVQAEAPLPGTPVDTPNQQG